MGKANSSGCITLSPGWTPPQYGFGQRVRIKKKPGNSWGGIFGKIIGLTYYEGEYGSCWFYEIKVDPNSPIAHFPIYHTSSESCLEPFPQEVMCHG